MDRAQNRRVDSECDSKVDLINLHLRSIVLYSLLT